MMLFTPAQSLPRMYSGWLTFAHATRQAAAQSAKSLQLYPRYLELVAYEKMPKLGPLTFEPT